MYRFIVALLFFSLTLCLTSQSNSVKELQKTQIEIEHKKAEYYLNQLQDNYNEGDYERHKLYSDSLLQVAKLNGFTKMNILALTNQAVFYNNRSERLEAIELYHQALKKCELIPEDFRSKIIVLINMGNTYNNIGFYDKAIDNMENVLYLLDTNENSDKIRAAALIGLANNYERLGDYKKTLHYASEAKQLADTLNNKQIQISALNNIADAYINLKDYKKAIDYGEVALELTSIEKPTKKRAWSLLNQGSANYYLQNYEISKNYLVECVNLAKEKKLIEVEMFAHDFLAKIYEENKDFEASVKEQKQYLEIRNLFLKDKKDASNADLNVEIESQGELIQENNEALEAVNQKSKLFVGLVISLLVVIGFILFYYRKRKKKTASQELKLRAQYLKLENDFNAYKSVNTAAKSIPNSNENMSLKPYKNSSLTPDKRKVYKRDILSYMKSEKPYLNPEMTQSDLANQLGISSHHFSEVLYYGMEQNFYNFINSYRILKAKSLIKSPKYRDAKIISIAYDSGFKSKTTFNRIFKRLTGITPSQYRNEVKNNQ